MDVILLKDVEKLGLRGEVVGVARGYARNFLLPRRLAEVATPAKVAEVERRESRRARHEASTNDEAQRVAKLLEETELRFDVAAGDTGTLFGSVTPTDIADELWSRKKIRVDRRKIDLPDTIKRVGRYTVPIEVFSGVVAQVRTIVVPIGGELPPEEPEQPETPEAPEPEAAPALEVSPEAEAQLVDRTVLEADVVAEPADTEPAAEAAQAEPLVTVGPDEGLNPTEAAWAEEIEAERRASAPDEPEQ